MSELMSIGTFSRASLLTVKALRNYHQSGLLVPARVDPTTGYRAYHVGQLADASVIRRLRELDVSLDDIRAVMEARDPLVTEKVLGQHLATMEERLSATQRIVDDLLVGTSRPTSLTPPTVFDTDHHHVAAIRGTVRRERYATFLEAAYGTLFTALEEVGMAPIAPAGACYPPEVDDREEVSAFIPVVEPFPVPPASGIVFEELPARRVASLSHRGPYEDIGDAYLALGHWVALNAEPLDEPVREWYVVSFPQSNDPSTFLTDIHWPVAADTGTGPDPRTEDS